MTAWHGRWAIGSDVVCIPVASIRVSQAVDLRASNVGLSRPIFESPASVTDCNAGPLLLYTILISEWKLGATELSDSVSYVVPSQCLTEEAPSNFSPGRVKCVPAVVASRVPHF